MSSIAENLERVRERIAQSAVKSGRAIDDVMLVAISKTHDAAKVREAKAGFGKTWVAGKVTGVHELKITIERAGDKHLGVAPELVGVVVVLGDEPRVAGKASGEDEITRRDATAGPARSRAW